MTQPPRRLRSLLALRKRARLSPSNPKPLHSRKPLSRPTLPFALVVAASFVTGVAGFSGEASAQAAPPASPQANPQAAPANPQTAPGANPQDGQNGVIKLPSGPPPTGLQAPLPPAALPIDRPDRPIRTSPRLNQLAAGLQTQPLTINDVVSIALATNRSLALAEESLLRAQGRTSETRAAFSPQVAGVGTITQLDAGSTATFGGQNGAPAQNINIVNAFQRQIGLQATLPIDISGLLRAATEQAQFQEIAARLDINRARNQIVLDVKSAFYDVLRNQALVAVATRSLQNSQARLTDSERKFTAGTVARFDVIRAQTDVANAEQQLITARSNVTLAIATLNNTIGIDINAPLRVSDAGAVETPPGVAPPSAVNVPSPPANPNAAPGTNPALPNAAPTPPNQADKAAAQSGATQEIAPTEGTGSLLKNVVYDPLELGPEYDAVVREAVATRPEVLEGDANIAAAQKGVRLARRSQYPTLGLTGGVTYAPDTAGFSPKTTSGQIGVSLNFPIFEGGLARARVTQARADVATAETNRRQSVDLVTLEVRQAYLTLQQSRSRVAVSNQALAQAQEAFRLARVRYNAGVSEQAGLSPLLEVSDAQNALTQAESNQVSALYDYNNARARLDKAAGRYSFIANAPGYAAPPSPQTTGAAGRGGRRK